jgi:LysM domain
MAGIDGSSGTNRSADTSAPANADNNTRDASTTDHANNDVAVADQLATVAPPDTKERPVKHGDTVRSIAEEEGITVQQLYELNPNIDPAKRNVPMDRMQEHWDPEYLQGTPSVNVPEVILAEAEGGTFAQPIKLDGMADAPIVSAQAEVSLVQPDSLTLSTRELVARAETGLRTAITGPEPSVGWSVAHEISAEFNDIKVGYAMGSLAASIEANLDSYPADTRAAATDYVEALRSRGDSLSFGAARDASPNAAVFAYKGQCYESANALAAAVTHERYDPTVTRMSEWTPEMQEQSQIAAMDREIWNRGAGTGFSFAETGYMIARGHGANAEELMRAYAAGQLADIALEFGGVYADVANARGGLNVHPGPDW